MRTRLTSHMINSSLRRSHQRSRRLFLRALRKKNEEQPNVPSTLQLTKLGKIFPIVMVIAILLLLAMYAFSYGLLPENLNTLIP